MQKRKNKPAGRPAIKGRTRFDAMVDLDLKQKANAARLAKENPDSWPELTERMLRFLEAGISTHDLTTALDLVLNALEQENKHSSKSVILFNRTYEPVKQMIRLSKWIEHNRR